MASQALQHESSIKDLGVVIDSKVNFNEQITTTSSKAFGLLLGLTKRIAKSFNDIHVLKSVYCAIIRGVLEYAAQV